MEIIDNVRHLLKDDLTEELHPHAKLSIAAASFSMYAFYELKKQLEDIDSLRFIFTSPTFTTEKTPKEKREFYIPRLDRERTVCGSEFEIKLRNEMTQQAVSRECADWIQKKASFKSNRTQSAIQGFIHVQKEMPAAYTPLNGFTTVDLGCSRGNTLSSFITKIDYPQTEQLLRTFDNLWNDADLLQDVTEQVLGCISSAYSENSPEFIYFVTLYNIFSEFLDDISEDVLPNEGTGFRKSVIWNKLYNFQQDAALAIINKLEKYNGCILADSVGLGKTYTALAVIKYYESRNRNVLVLCPKKLGANWNTFRENYVNNPVAADRFAYTVLFHTDLSRNGGDSNGIDLSRINWANYDLVVIDESHNFRNGTDTVSKVAGKAENRYLRLMNRVLKPGVRTKVLMLSATPVNNRFTDLKNQLALAYEGNSGVLGESLHISHSIEDIFRSAQKAFNDWSKLPAEQRKTQTLLGKLDFDFFELLDSVTIARSRRHIEKYYDTSAIGTFPERLKPLSLSPVLTDLPRAITYNEIYGQLTRLNLFVYVPTRYIQPSLLGKYVDMAKLDDYGLTLDGREQGIRRLMSINLLKRLESSVYSFRETLERIDDLIGITIARINQYEAHHSESSVDAETDSFSSDDFDEDDSGSDFFTVGRKVKIDLADMDYVSWRRDMEADKETLALVISMVSDITPSYDTKLTTLRKTIEQKIEHPINGTNRKVIVFTAFADTARYLFDTIAPYFLSSYGMHTALVTGSGGIRTTYSDFSNDFNAVLTCFSPVSKEKPLVMPGDTHEFDILIATDCISEGQNLQDCDYLVNYDIHWNPVRIIQRFGRIDRIGSKNKQIQLVNFWPDISLDEYINLKSRVETRMKLSVMTATGDDDPINQEERGDLEYRRSQLKRLHEEVVDLEEMNSGISITDLGLNEFRLDLLEYMKQNRDIEHAHNGMHAVVHSCAGLSDGVIFVLKNLNNGVNIDSRNRRHPFYMVYIADDGHVICNHLAPKQLLDDMRLLCRGHDTPDAESAAAFNRETHDGRNMQKYSELLGKAVESVITVKDESDIESLFSPGGTSALSAKIRGLEDFELIDFIVIKN